MQVGQTGQYTPNGIIQRACMLVGNVVNEVWEFPDRGPGNLVTHGRADLVVWNGSGVQSFRAGVVYDAEGTTPNSFRV